MDSKEGDRFGRLVLRQYIGAQCWLCHCDCGADKAVHIKHLRNGHTQSCGCFQKEVTKQLKIRHGHAVGNNHGTPTYQSWRSMLDRCRQPSHPHFDRYGGRGISVCERWQGPEGFANFLRDMGERPDGCSIDRIDNDRNYEPSNCRWAGQKTQHRNKVSNVNLTLNGKTQCLLAWAEELGVGATTLSARKRRGMTDEEVLTQPVGRWQEKKPPPITKRPPKACSNCHQNATPSRGGRCASCAQYYRRTGIERPRENFNTNPRPLKGVP